jgi:hypothetical protein
MSHQDILSQDKRIAEKTMLNDRQIARQPHVARRENAGTQQTNAKNTF